MKVDVLEADAPAYPGRLQVGPSACAPPRLTVLGNLDLLALPTTALFCSARCPGKVILRAYDLATQLRDTNRAVISGFHSPVEKECLAIILRGKSPIIFCPARSLERFRLPADWKQPLAEGRLLVLSPFPAGHHRATTETAQRRNEFLAALATEIIVLYATPGGRLANLVKALEANGRTITGVPTSAT